MVEGWWAIEEGKHGREGRWWVGNEGSKMAAGRMAGSGGCAGEEERKVLDKGWDRSSLCHARARCDLRAWVKVGGGCQRRGTKGGEADGKAVPERVDYKASKGGDHAANTVRVGGLERL